MVGVFRWKAPMFFEFKGGVYHHLALELLNEELEETEGPKIVTE